MMVWKVLCLLITLAMVIRVRLRPPFWRWASVIGSLTALGENRAVAGRRHALPGGEESGLRGELRIRAAGLAQLESRSTPKGLPLESVFGNSIFGTSRRESAHFSISVPGDLSGLTSAATILKTRSEFHGFLLDAFPRLCRMLPGVHLSPWFPRFIAGCEFWCSADTKPCATISARRIPCCPGHGFLQTYE